MRKTSLLLFLLLTAGCGDNPQPLFPLEEVHAAPAVLSRFDANTTGKVQGRVFWQGPQPDPAEFTFPEIFPGALPRFPECRNPHIPKISSTGGMGSAIVFLRGVDPQRARPWDLPQARIELSDFQILARQGDGPSAAAAFARVGDEVEMVSRQSVFHILRARGEAFFTLTFPEPNLPRHRSMQKKGIVEFSSAANHFWARAWLFVDDHPYYTRTDDEGHFVLPQVPEGTYELVVWHPNWRELRHEHDPELGMIARLWYRPPAEVKQSVVVRRGETTEAAPLLSLDKFE